MLSNEDKFDYNVPNVVVSVRHHDCDNGVAGIAHSVRGLHLSLQESKDRRIVQIKKANSGYRGIGEWKAWEL